MLQWTNWRVTFIRTRTIVILVTDFGAQCGAQTVDLAENRHLEDITRKVVPSSNIVIQKAAHQWNSNRSVFRSRTHPLWTIRGGVQNYLAPSSNTEVLNIESTAWDPELLKAKDSVTLNIPGGFQDIWPPPEERRFKTSTHCLRILTISVLLEDREKTLLQHSSLTHPWFLN